VAGYNIKEYRSYDIFMNLVLENAKEIITEIRPGMPPTETFEDIGYTIVRGNSIVMWECLDKVRDI
jgi:small nuclear ribonucleoprotein G